MSIELVPFPDQPNPGSLSPKDLVEYLYVPEDETKADIVSRDLMRDYLRDRFVPDAPDRVTVISVPIGRTWPKLARVPNGTKEVGYWYKTKEWLISPKVAAIVSLGSLALSQAGAAAELAENAYNSTSHRIYRHFNPVEDHVVKIPHTSTVPGKVITIKAKGQANNEVGSSNVDPAAVELFVKTIAKEKAKGSTIGDVTVTGLTSDEWGGDSSIGKGDKQNQKLGQSRAEATAAAVTEGLKARNISIKISSVRSKESLVTASQRKTLQETAKAAGFGSMSEAVHAVDGGNKVSEELAGLIKSEFSDQRGALLEADVTEPGKSKTITTTEVKTIPGEDNPPVPGKIDFDPWLIPLLPIRRRAHGSELRGKKRWAIIPSRPLYRREVIREDSEHAWVRLRPEAIKEDSTLVPNPWAYTRKYEHLMRDGRIADVVKADFTNKEGIQKTIRVMFIDKSPADQTVEAFETLLERFVAMEDGKLAERISGIFVYPAGNAGLKHGDPKKIGLGVDKQSEVNILGTCTPILELVEMHMTESWDYEELAEAFATITGPLATLAHEVAGHGTDIKDGKQSLRRVIASTIPNAYIPVGSPWRERMLPLQRILKNLPRFAAQKLAAGPTLFDIIYAAADNNGNLVTLTARVDENDPRIACARSAAIVGYKPTQYARQSVFEHYAETAAAVTTGFTVPYREARVTVPKLTSDDGKPTSFADGYRPSTHAQQLFTSSVNGTTGSYPIEFVDQPKVSITFTKPDNDKLLRAEMIRSRKARILRPNDMIAILTRIVGRK